MLITGEEFRFLQSVFDLIEHVNRQELRNSSKQLIRNYIEESGGLTLADCGREAVERYTNNMLPSLERLREKSKLVPLEALDHLVLKMEWAAEKLEVRKAKGKNQK
jgi:hypothetical protein